MKKLAVLAILAALAIMAYGLASTGAWFTTAKTIENNSVTTGTLNMAVWGGPFVGTNLEPGADYKPLGTFCLKNDGDYGMKFRGWMYEVTDPKGLANYIKVRAILNPDNMSIEGLKYGPANYKVFDNVPFNELAAPNNYIVAQSPAEAMQPGYTACYRVEAKVDSSAPDSVQGASLTTKFNLQGTQYINTGWDQ